MLVQSLTTVIEAALIDPIEKRFTGNVTDSSKLLSDDNLSKLEQMHDGLFAFIAFHPAADKLVTEYIKAGSLGADSGRHIFVLFTLDGNAHKPQRIDKNAFEDRIEIDDGEYPAYELVRGLFPNEAVELPGILFIQKFSKPSEPVLVSFRGQKTLEDLTALARQIFETGTSVYLNGAQGDFPEKFSIAMARKTIPYKRGGSTSMREWMVKAFYQARKNLGDIVTVVKLFK